VPTVPAMVLLAVAPSCGSLAASSAAVRIGILHIRGRHVVGG